MFNGENENKNKKRLIIGSVMGGLVLLVSIVFGGTVLMKGMKDAANSVFNNTVKEDTAGEEKPLYNIEELPVIDIDAENYTPSTRTEGISWDSTLFYWLEDINASDNTDGNINNCVIYKTYMRDADTGNILQYEVYADALSGQIYKIVSIEQLEGTLRIIDYYYDNGKPNFIFLREDSVYTPTYATIGKTGDRYYFNNDVMVRWRTIATPNVISEYVLTSSDVTYAQFQYSTLAVDQQNAYDITEIKMLNAAYNTYNAILNTEAVGIVEGRLVDTTGEPLSNMTVKIYSEADDTLLYQAITDIEGFFHIYVYLNDSKCYLVMEETDIFRVHNIYNINLHRSSYGYSCNDVVMHKIAGDEYPIYIDLYSALEIGKVEEESVMGELLQGANVSIREGSNAYEGDVIKVLETDETGRLTANLPSGIYTAQIQMTGYADSYIEVIVNESETVVNGYLLPMPNQGETGIVMTWSGADVDLDLTLFTPYQSTGGDMAHIGGNVTNDNYGNRLVSDNNAYCEVMYVNTANVGSYKLFVNNYTDSMAGNYSSTVLANVNICIYIYDCNGFVTVYTFPINQSGVVWEVVEINGTNLIPVHRIYDQLDGKVWWVESKEAGRLLKKITYFDYDDSQGVIQWDPEDTTEYIYDNAGKLVQENEINPYGEEIHIYTYDINGRVETKTSTEYYNDVVAERIHYYKYNEQGNLIYIDERYICEGYEGFEADYYYVTEYSYNNMGKISGYRRYNVHNGIREQVTYDYVNYYYDENGNISKEVYPGFALVHIYDSKGNRLWSVEGDNLRPACRYTEYIYENSERNIISTDDLRKASADIIAAMNASGF